MGIRPVADFETLNYQIITDLNTSTNDLNTTETAIGFIPCYRLPFLSLYQIDVLEGLKNIPDKSQYLIIADPPYFKIVKDKWDNNWKNEADYLNWCELWIKECFRVLKDSGTFYLWGGIGKHKEHPLFKQIALSEDIGFVFQDWITWKKQKGLGSKKGFMFIREELIYFTKSNEFTCNTPYLNEIAKNHGRLSKEKVNYKRCGNVWTDINEVTVGNLIHTERVKHPTQKPLKACLRIVETSSNENDNVLIPFAGSGSEIVACEELKRNCIAFEIESKYIDIIKQRTNDAITFLVYA
jgi:DNA modification methylase